VLIAPALRSSCASLLIQLELTRKLGSFRHFPSSPPSGPVGKPLPARAHFARTPLVMRESSDSIGINSQMASFRHFSARRKTGTGANSRILELDGCNRFAP